MQLRPSLSSARLPLCPSASATGCQASCARRHCLSATSNQPVGPSFYTSASTDRLVLVELFGGICAGLEMVLVAGFTGALCAYANISTPAQAATRHRLQQLSLQYSEQLPPTAWEGSFLRHLSIRRAPHQHQPAVYALHGLRQSSAAACRWLAL